MIRISCRQTQRCCHDLGCLKVYSEIAFFCISSHHDSIVEFDDTEFASHTTPNHPNDTRNALRSQLAPIYYADDSQCCRFQSKAWNPLNFWNLNAESLSADTTNPIFRFSIIREYIDDITTRFPAQHTLSSYVKMKYHLIHCPNRASLHNLSSFWNEQK